MVDKAEHWMSSYIINRRNVDWSEFVIDLSARFRDEIGVNIVEKFNKVSQIASLEEYVDEFEELKSLMLQRNHILPDSYFLDSFIRGLKPNLKPTFKPETMSEAIHYAKLREENVLATQTKPSFPSKYTKHALPPLLPTPPNTSKLTTTIQPTYSRPFQTNAHKPQINISREERREKQLRGECYFCDKPYERDISVT